MAILYFGWALKRSPDVQNGLTLHRLQYQLLLPRSGEVQLATNELDLDQGLLRFELPWICTYRATACDLTMSRILSGLQDVAEEVSPDIWQSHQRHQQRLTHNADITNTWAATHVHLRLHDEHPVDNVAHLAIEQQTRQGRCLFPPSTNRRLV